MIYTLLDNATKYAPPQTPILIQADNDKNGMVKVSVEDGGPGIEPALREHVFEKFFRANGGGGISGRAQGLGMGLPIAKAIIAAQQGNISVTSQLGHGSVFSFTLPVDHTQAADRVHKDVR